MKCFVRGACSNAERRKLNHLVKSESLLNMQHTRDVSLRRCVASAWQNAALGLADAIANKCKLVITV